MSKSWSTHQEGIFQFSEFGTGNANIVAVAGSGKTTTIVEALNRVKGTTIFLAFNKAIAEELKSRGVNARTFHSLTYVPVTQFKGERNVTTDKLNKLLKNGNFSERQIKLYGAFIMRLVGLARQQGIGCLVPDEAAEYQKIVDHHGLDLDNEEAKMSEAIDLAGDLLMYSNKSKMVDFDDLLYLSVKENLSLPKYDVIFVDEAQDTNAIQRAILKKIMKPTSRIICVGDPAQAIYGFRGADSDSLDLIAKTFNSINLPLSITYRCPKSVVEYAQQWVKHIEAAPNAEEGLVKHHGTSWTNKVFNCEDLVVCRRTAPLITLAFNMLRDRISVQVMGRDIGEGLKALIKRMQAQGIDALVKKLETYKAREMKRLKDLEQDAKAEAVADKVDCILTLIEEMSENNRTVPALVDIIDSLFADKKACVTLATIHKSKGLEANRVFWLDSDYSPTWPMKPWQLKQEDNLCYVAATRAKKELHTIQPTKKVRK